MSCCVFVIETDWQSSGVPSLPFVTVIPLLWSFLVCSAAAGHHTVYVGVHVPKSYHRRRRHRRKSSHKEKRERTEHCPEGHKSDADEASASILRPLSESISSVQCVFLCVAVGVFRAACKTQFTGYRSFFCWGGKRSCESWVGWWRKWKKISLNGIPGEGGLEHSLQTMLGSLEVGSNSSGWKKRNGQTKKGCSATRISRLSSSLRPAAGGHQMLCGLRKWHWEIH